MAAALIANPKMFPINPISEKRLPNNNPANPPTNNPFIRPPLVKPPFVVVLVDLFVVEVDLFTVEFVPVLLSWKLFVVPVLLL